MIGRRGFITLLGGAAATWPLPARAERGAMPVIGVLGSTSAESLKDVLPGFRQGLYETGYIEGQNIAIEYRWAENQIERLPALATDLVRRQVAVIASVRRHRFGIRRKSGDRNDPHCLHDRRRPG